MRKYFYESEKTRRAVIKTASAAFVVNLTLSAVKLPFGFLQRNTAVIADGVYTLFAALISGFTLLNIFTAKLQPVERGRGKIEPAAALVTAAAFIGAGGWLFYQGIMGFFNPESFARDAGAYALVVVTGASVLIKETLYRYTVRCAKRIGSQVLAHDARRHRFDCIPALAVLAGLGSGLFLAMDWILSAAIAVSAAFIIMAAAKKLQQSVVILLGKAAGGKIHNALKKLVREVENVRSVNRLILKRFGDAVQAEVEISVDTGLMAIERHEVTEAVRAALANQRLCEVRRCIVRVDS